MRTATAEITIQRGPHIRVAMLGQPRFIKFNLMAPADCESYFGFMLIGDRPSR